MNIETIIKQKLVETLSSLGLNILADDVSIETSKHKDHGDYSSNIALKNANKLSLSFELPHESGSLYHLLSHFIHNNLNMTKIESRPVEGKAWEYRFFIDCEGNLEDQSVKNAIRGLRSEAKNLKILGNY